MEEKKGFEELMARLDQVVAALERGDVPLEAALTLFEEGTALIKTCSEMLDQAEQKVLLLSSGADGPELTPFAVEE